MTSTTNTGIVVVLVTLTIAGTLFFMKDSIIVGQNSSQDQYSTGQLKSSSKGSSTNSFMLKSTKKSMLKGTQSVMGGSVQDGTGYNHSEEDEQELPSISPLYSGGSKFNVQDVEAMKLGDFFAKLYPGKSVFEVLGAYDAPASKEDVYSYPGLTTNYSPATLGLKSNPNYCHESDMFKINNPHYVFDEINVLTSMNYFPQDAQVQTAFHQLGANINAKSNWWYKPGSEILKNEHNLFLVQHIDVKDIPLFGRSFGCTTQMFNHHSRSFLNKKYFIPPMINMYAEKHQGKPEKCFNKEDIAPATYRLANKKQCLEFFNILKTDAYKESLKKNPNQYIIKPGSDSQQGDGIFLLDDAHTAEFHKEFGYDGERCGKPSNYIAQRYLANPILLEGKKFDFRIFLNIVSENPMIAFYGGGYIRKSLFKYDPNSHDNRQHLTNNAFAEKIIEEMKKSGQTYEGKNTDELARDSIWTLEEFQDYLLKEGKITDTNWLNNYLKPQFKKIMVHVLKMLQPNFQKNSQTFEFFGLDFMITDDMKVWLIELNEFPTHSYLRDNQYFVDLWIQRMNIQLAYYRSRMKRVFRLLQAMKDEYAEHGFVEVAKYKRKFVKANLNGLEPEYKEQVIQKSFEPVMDETLQGANRYFGLIDPDCIINVD